ncbi:MAG: tripartite tricarboxylate transporter TctB family protein [Desulfarculaceae bacterium]|jgi:hypothetical protein
MVQTDPHSRVHDLFAALLGLFALGVLVSAPWQVDSEGPYPFYKGPLIFPLLVLSLMVLAALPSACRLLRPAPDATWRLDGAGLPQKPAMVAVMLIAFLAGMIILGLELSSFLFLVGALYFLGQRALLRLLGVPLLVTAIVVFVFKYGFEVFFPTPLLWEWLVE